MKLAYIRTYLGNIEKVGYLKSEFETSQWSWNFILDNVILVVGKRAVGKRAFLEFPTLLGRFQHKQKLTNFRLLNLKLSNFSLFLTAISNYTYPLLTCRKLSNFSIFPNTLSNFAYIFFYRGWADKCVQTYTIFFVSDRPRVRDVWFKNYGTIPAKTPSMDP